MFREGGQRNGLQKGEKIDKSTEWSSSKEQGHYTK